MKKITNVPEQYMDDIFNGIYVAHPDMVKYTENDLRCYCIAQKKQGKVVIIAGGGTGHLPLFLGYADENLLDGCGVGGVFQSLCVEQIYNAAKEAELGAGILFLCGNYTGDIMNFDMASGLLEMDDIKTASTVGADDVLSSKGVAARQGVAGILFMYKCVGAGVVQMGTLEEVLAVAKKAEDNTRIVGLALTPCIIPEIGCSNLTLAGGEMIFGMGIHGKPGAWSGPVKTADELADESVDKISSDMPPGAGEEACVLINGLGTTGQEELYILSGSVHKLLNKKGIRIHHAFVGEYTTSMEMAGASASIRRMVNREMKQWIDMLVYMPLYTQARRLWICEGGKGWTT